MTFANILKEYLDSENMKQSEFAKEVGIKSSKVNEWLAGKAKPAYDSLKLMATKLNVSADYLLGITDTY
ncbi:MAG: helix-turn-helix transcriptional regulator [Clostridia bacterium]|nr:helix-turn-helix transcriptional regulator [Clostridia bacterium]